MKPKKVIYYLFRKKVIPGKKQPKQTIMSIV
jgi:hypothetical protein